MSADIICDAPLRCQGHGSVLDDTPGAVSYTHLDVYKRQVLRRSPWRLLPGDTVDLDRAVDRGLLSLRGYDRCLRLAWTAADLRGAARPGRDDVGLALSLRHRPAVAA